MMTHGGGGFDAVIGRGDVDKLGRRHGSGGNTETGRVHGRCCNGKVVRGHGNIHDVGEWVIVVVHHAVEAGSVGCGRVDSGAI